MKNPLILFITLALLLFSCDTLRNKEITEEEIISHIEYLSSDELAGRYPGTAEDSVLLTYLSNQFRSYRLKSFKDGYLQSFDFLSGIEPSDYNTVIFNETPFNQGQEYYPFSFSASGELSAPVIFCGYGFDFSTKEKSRNDYADVNPDGKWVLIMRGEPENHSAFIDRSRDRDKALLAMEKGAAGVLLVAGTDYAAKDELDKGLNREPEIGIPVLQVTRKFASKIMEESGHIIEKMAERSVNDPTFNYESQHELEAAIQIDKLYSKTANVVAYLEPLDSGNDQWIVIGAHHDHLGMGGKGSSSRAPDTIAVHNGADDNASGVAAILELAEYFSAKKNRPATGLIFVTFGAEEKGLLGSRYFTENSPVELNKIMYMINIDMLGRMKEDSSIQVGGTGTSDVGSVLLDSLNKKYSLNITQSSAGYGPSDHAAFYSKDIPVYFFSTGAHQDYHTPFDDADSINYKGLKLGTEFIAGLIKELDIIDKAPVFREAGPKASTSRSFRNRITLGIMPDVSGESKEGMKVLAVTSGKPAELGGMKKGDIIIAIEGKEISNVYDYMYRLNDLKEGDRVIVSVKRNQETVDLLIEL